MSFDIFAAYATDENLENSGVQFPLGDGKLLIARSGTRKYNRAITKHVELRRVELDQGGPGASDAVADAVAKVNDEIMVEVMADTILLGWTNMSLKGVDIPYSPENVRQVLSIKDFRKMVGGLADSIDAYKVKAEIVTGNA